jgi:hypothetical protein
VDVSIVSVPRQRNSRQENVLIKGGSEPGQGRAIARPEGIEDP